MQANKLGVTTEALRAKIDCKSALSKERGQFAPPPSAHTK